MNAPVQALPEGTSIAGYDIERLLDSDQFGLIYAAHARAGVPVIVREFFPQAIATRGSANQVACAEARRESFALALNRLERLSRKLCQFSHPNFVPILGFARENGTGYVIQAASAGQSLEEWLLARPPPHPRELQPILDPILDALSSLHRRGGVHQDVSPQNIMMASDGRPMLAGAPTLAEVLAIALGHGFDPARAKPERIPYLAPEQATGTTGLRVETDIYAAGAVLYRCFAAAPPIDAAPRMEGLRFYNNDPYVPLRAATKVAVTEPISEAVDRALAIRRTDRLQSIDELRAAIRVTENVVTPGGRGQLPPPAEPPPSEPHDISAIAAPQNVAMAAPPAAARASLTPLSLTELAAQRGQAERVAEPSPPPAPTPSGSAAPPMAPPGHGRARVLSWLGGSIAAAMVLVAGAELGENPSLQARLPRDPAIERTGLVVIASLVFALILGVGLLRSRRRRLRELKEQVAEEAGKLPVPSSQPVDVSAFAPQSVPAGGRALVQVYLHVPSQAAETAALANEADPGVKRRGVRTLSAHLPIGETVQISLEAPGLHIEDPLQSLVWTGDPSACQFLVRVPRNAAGTTFHFCVRVVVNTVQLGSLRFTLTATARDNTDPSPRICGETAQTHRHAFLSYARADRAEVLRTVQTLKATRIEFFQDLLTLEPGERWEKRLYEEIDRCDLFLLFWSSHSAKSDWVKREAEYALARSKKNALPEITPIILEGPPVPLPPSSLQEIHFNDWVRYVIAAVESEKPEP